MSQTIQHIFNTSELALAAYANLANNSQTVLSSNINVLVEAGMSTKQAEEFAKRYPTVITQYTDPDTSFTATVFNVSST